MALLTRYLPGLTKRQQIFTSSGTFTPSSRLLELGGWVEVLCVGGGGGGYYPGSGNVRTGGGGGGVVRSIVQVTGIVAVTIGSGGTGGASPTAGGTTSFGSLVSAAGGQPGGSTFGGASGNGLVSQHAGGAGAGGVGAVAQLVFAGYYIWYLAGVVSLGGPGLDGYGAGGGGSTRTDYYGITPCGGPPNTGRGGTGGDSGASGICIVEWWE